MSLITLTSDSCTLTSATAMPRASGFLWNRKMMLHATCRGFVTAQHMQPEPARYSHAPVVEGKTFMLPETAHYAHHPGRFVYVRDLRSGRHFSVPHEPVRRAPQAFGFTQHPERLEWSVQQDGLDINWSLVLPVDEPVELWRLEIRNRLDTPRVLRIVPYFPVGYMSWMNQGARFAADLNAVVASSVTAYQKVEDYFKNQHLKDKTFLTCDRIADAFETRREDFEGEGGLTDPDMLRDGLKGGEAAYETPAAILQFDQAFEAGETQAWHFVFGPAFDEAEVARLKSAYLGAEAFDRTCAEARAYVEQGRGVLSIETPDAHFDAFMNRWLARQVYYHGDTNRLTTDPQTRNYLQDALGMVFVRPDSAKASLLYALSKQNPDGSMPDGIKLYDGAQFSYINQVPHTDHCVWLFMLLEAYLDETDDYAVLDADVAGQSVRARLEAALHWLLKTRDHRLLSFIDQGDWNDPMNMVGWKGKGVSGWLTLAVAYALRLWARLSGQAAPWLTEAEAMNAAMNTHLWDGDWFGRGITDDDVKFGIKSDAEGRIYLNPQSFALLSGAASEAQGERMVSAVATELETPYGVEMLGPPYTKMREDVGRLTQKSPGVAENGSVYNHAAAFYIYSLTQVRKGEKAFELMRKMIAGTDVADYGQRGQFPVFIPNYYRGDFHANPRTAGRSSQLFNTGTVAWVYRSLVEGLFGLKGTREGLSVRPCLPAYWSETKATRLFRGSTYHVTYRRGDQPGLMLDGQPITGDVLPLPQTPGTFEVVVTL
ncbi:GH36-type glycosyl hydrolase domain-containing protein [Asticcacaulis sp. AND118]|uniref:GH36-type glycosyl hydrolase domain-containing protein n=1 Tax=Asticcacaulis sp. AND118 TaxID=2840468 RepID=UPI001CFFFF1B|nr:glycosyltransferase 36 [Asticcacaulis sp. AND118]UDF05129.1 glycosyltransferase 36 [Asticcacaulis sp. AND118]